jgi:hypothetical protein
MFTRQSHCSLLCRWRSYLPDEEFDNQLDARGGGQLPFPVTFIDASGNENPFQCDSDPTENTLQLAQLYQNSAIPISELLNLWTNPTYECTPEKVADGIYCNNPWSAPAQNPPVFEVSIVHEGREG